MFKIPKMKRHDITLYIMRRSHFCVPVNTLFPNILLVEDRFSCQDFASFCKDILVIFIFYVYG